MVAPVTPQALLGGSAAFRATSVATWVIGSIHAPGPLRPIGAYEGSTEPDITPLPTPTGESQVYVMVDDDNDDDDDDDEPTYTGILEPKKQKEDIPQPSSQASRQNLGKCFWAPSPLDQILDPLVKIQGWREVENNGLCKYSERYCCYCRTVKVKAHEPYYIRATFPPLRHFIVIQSNRDTSVYIG